MPSENEKNERKKSANRNLIETLAFHNDLFLASDVAELIGDEETRAAVEGRYEMSEALKGDVFSAHQRGGLEIALAALIAACHDNEDYCQGVARLIEDFLREYPEVSLDSKLFDSLIMAVICGGASFDDVSKLVARRSEKPNLTQAEIELAVQINLFKMADWQSAAEYARQRAVDPQLTQAELDGGLLAAIKQGKVEQLDGAGDWVFFSMVSLPVFDRLMEEFLRLGLYKSAWLVKKYRKDCPDLTEAEWRRCLRQAIIRLDDEDRLNYIVEPHLEFLLKHDVDQKIISEYLALVIKQCHRLDFWNGEKQFQLLTKLNQESKDALVDAYIERGLVKRSYDSVIGFVRTFGCSSMAADRLIKRLIEIGEVGQVLEVLPIRTLWPELSAEEVEALTSAYNSRKEAPTSETDCDDPLSRSAATASSLSTYSNLSDM